jgi:prepilin-type processing-associated H-X9-DG protein
MKPAGSFGCATVSRGRSFHVGFSLLELLLTIAIIMVIMALYWGAGSSSRQQQLKASCKKNLEKDYIALQIYANDFSGKFPSVSGAHSSKEPLNVLVPRYTSDTSLFICPASKDSDLLNRVSYSYYMGRHSTDPGTDPLMSDSQVDTNAKTAGDYVFSKDGKAPGNNHDKYGGNVLFCDGHAEPTPARAAFGLPLTNGVVLLNP